MVLDLCIIIQVLCHSFHFFLSKFINSFAMFLHFFEYGHVKCVWKVIVWGVPDIELTNIVTMSFLATNGLLLFFNRVTKAPWKKTWVYHPGACRIFFLHISVFIVNIILFHIFPVRDSCCNVTYHVAHNMIA